MYKMLLYLPQRTNRLDYVIDLIFKQLLGFEGLEYADSLDEFLLTENLIKISYGRAAIDENPFLLESSSLLLEEGIGEIQPQFEEIEGLKACFLAKHQSSKALLPFDFLAMTFYLVSRYEEYLPFEADMHGRFTAQHSQAYKNNFLAEPLINLWAERLREKLQVAFPNHPIPAKRQFSFQPSYDIDFAWMYLHKGWKRQFGGLVRDFFKGNWALIRQRLSVLSAQKTDPFYTFDYLDHLHQKYPQFQPIYFWLLGKYGPYDKNTNPQHPKMQELLKKLSNQYLSGIHPSYASNDHPESLTAEINALEKITQEKVLHNRQHFLRLNFPETYSRLLAEGIQHDYSMGYANEVGFRASIANSFFWFDLENNTTTSLKVHPFMVMDVTLKRYLKISNDAVLAYIKPIIDQSKSVGGELMTIWHNNSFCECEGWQGWRQIYEEILKEI